MCIGCPYIITAEIRLARGEANFLSKIRQLREAQGLTQQALASRVGVTQATVSDWENGKITPDVVRAVKLADLFGTTLDVIYGRSAG